MTGETTDRPEGLTGLEFTALQVAAACYEAVRGSPALDDPAHWDRFASRLKSAAYAQTAPRFLAQISQRFGCPHTPGDDLVRLLRMPPEECRRVLRIIREQSNALSVLVRDQRSKRRPA